MSVRIYLEPETTVADGEEPLGDVTVSFDPSDPASIARVEQTLRGAFNLHVHLLVDDRKSWYQTLFAGVRRWRPAS